MHSSEDSHGEKKKTATEEERRAERLAELSGRVVCWGIQQEGSPSLRQVGG